MKKFIIIILLIIVIMILNITGYLNENKTNAFSLIEIDIEKNERKL